MNGVNGAIAATS